MPGSPEFDGLGVTGWISIPYQTSHGGIVTMAFRRVGDGKPKYLTPYPRRPYNTMALDRADQLGYIAIVEGEIDAMTLDYCCDIPAVAIPGASTWQGHPEWADMFEGYQQVFVFPDDDKDGKRLAGHITGDIRQARVIGFIEGKDINEAYLALGGGLRAAAVIRRKAGLDV